MKTSIAQSILLATIVAGIGIAAGMTWAAPDQGPASGFAWKDGPEVYAKICAFCHETHIGPVIRGRSLDPLYITYIVRHGDRAMPAFRPAEIDDESLNKLAEYLSKTAPDQ